MKEGFDYFVIDKTSLWNIKASIDVRLIKKISKNKLLKLGKKLHAGLQKKYDRVFICYYLPDMKVGEGAWATTHFDPDIEVNILPTF